MAQPQKRRPESARRANRIIQTRTLLLLGVFGVLTFVLLFTKLYHWQITEHDELQSVAVRQQTLRTTVEASRGTIYDRNGTILAMSASAEDIFLSPKEIVENDQDQNLIANGLAEILNLDAADILKKMEKTNSQYEILKKKRTMSLPTRYGNSSTRMNSGAFSCARRASAAIPRGRLPRRSSALPTTTAARWDWRRPITTN